MTRGWTFRLPHGFGDGLESDLSRVSLVGKDGVPWPTTAMRDGETLVADRERHESLSLQFPLSLPAFGKVLVQTCSLPEGRAYRLLVELARGGVDKAGAALAECERKQ